MFVSSLILKSYDALVDDEGGIYFGFYLDSFSLL